MKSINPITSQTPNNRSLISCVTPATTDCRRPNPLAGILKPVSRFSMYSLILPVVFILFEVMACAIPVSAQTVYNVMSYGATGNGTTVDTAAIQNAVNAAASAGG